MSDEEANSKIDSYLAEKARLVHDQRHAGDEDEERDSDAEEASFYRLERFLAFLLGAGIVYVVLKVFL